MASKYQRIELSERDVNYGATVVVVSKDSTTAPTPSQQKATPLSLSKGLVGALFVGAVAGVGFISTTSAPLPVLGAARPELPASETIQVVCAGALAGAAFDCSIVSAGDGGGGSGGGGGVGSPGESPAAAWGSATGVFNRSAVPASGWHVLDVQAEVAGAAPASAAGLVAAAFAAGVAEGVLSCHEVRGACTLGRRPVFPCHPTFKRSQKNVK